ncbi:hypothetical protein VTJ49DRAFT_5527 [Mycothermus thermophilus]|uniref:Uncharacterized protein n=1 Tax=Humicola insolens TaxID=85995 RepID=A0ABR3V354_HUMIN
MATSAALALPAPRSVTAPAGKDGAGAARGEGSSAPVEDTAAEDEPRFYAGRIDYSNGEIHIVWVTEEVRDVGCFMIPAAEAAKPRQAGKKGGGSAVVASRAKRVKIDKDGARIYTRKRYDVWATVYYGPGRGRRRRNYSHQVLTFEEDNNGGATAGVDEPGNGRSGEAEDEDERAEAVAERDQLMLDDAEGGTVATTPSSTVADSPTDASAPSPSTPGTSVPDTSASSTSVPGNSLHRQPPADDDDDLPEWSRKLCGTYTTLPAANQAALKEFLELARPRNAYIDDVTRFRGQICPKAKEDFRADGLGKPGCTRAAHIEMDLEAEDWDRWGFRKVVVEVVASDLQGPVELGDMVVEEEEDGGDEGGEEEGEDEGEVVEDAGVSGNVLEESEASEE